MQYQLRISGNFYRSLQQHLFPGDGKEAVAVVICGRHQREGLSILLTYKLELIPYSECTREDEFITWKTERIIPLLEEAAKKGLGILKIHSHPGGYNQFSSVDDRSDYEFFSSVFGWCDADSIHSSAVMLPNGQIFGRVFDPSLKAYPLDKISIAGDEILSWSINEEISEDDFSVRTIQTFGEGTYSKLKQLKVAIIGCSGTGSPTIEQLYRLGVGELILVDPDKVEFKNLNRILNTKRSDAQLGKLKTDVLQEVIEKVELGTRVKTYSVNLYDSLEALQELITCDVIFGCVDSVDGRHLINQLTNFYLIPYFDLGVRLDADGQGGINKIVASVNYIQPGASSLLSRKLYTTQRLAAEGLMRQDPQEYEKRKKQQYIQGVEVNRPAVISINMQISSLAVIEFLNRIHPFKGSSARDFARVMIDCTEGIIFNEQEDTFDLDNSAVVWAGRGDCQPFLRMPELQR